MHKGGQINNVQLITGVRIAEMSQLQNCSRVGACGGGVRVDVYKELIEVIVKMKNNRGGGGQVRCVQRIN